MLLKRKKERVHLTITWVGRLASKIVDIWTDVIIEDDGHFTEMTDSFFIIGC
jgi:hypothetical protein